MRLLQVPLLDRWARASQQGSRSNAMVATTVLTQRRVERDEVEAYLARRTGRRTAQHAVTVTAVAATR
jgi:hypothetical protein